MNPLITCGVGLLVFFLFAKIFLGLLKVAIFLVNLFLSLIALLGLLFLCYGLLKEGIKRLG